MSKQKETRGPVEESTLIRSVIIPRTTTIDSGMDKYWVCWKAAHSTASNLGMEHQVQHNWTASDILLSLWNMAAENMFDDSNPGGRDSEGTALEWVLTEFNSWIKEYNLEVSVIPNGQMEYTSAEVKRTDGSHPKPNKWYVGAKNCSGHVCYLWPDGMWRYGCVLPEAKTSGYYDTKKEADLTLKRMQRDQLNLLLEVENNNE